MKKFPRKKSSQKSISEIEFASAKAIKNKFKNFKSRDQKHDQKDEMGFFKTLFLALICAGIIRSFFFEPFHIPSGSMKPNLLIGDYIFVSKFSYGYSRYSFPFGFNFFEGRIFKNSPKRGDIVVFRLPSDPSINYVKRMIGLPGDQVQMRNGVLFINNQEVTKNADGVFSESDFGEEVVIQKFREKFPEGKEIITLDMQKKSEDDTGIYVVPEGHYFFMGDNRDNSQDSRFLSKVGYVPEENLVGRATIIFFSSEKPLWQIWNWPNSIRFGRIFQKLN